MTFSLPAPIWVDTSTALQHLVEVLSRQPCIAVDTEANSLHAYREQVCLIQFSTPEKDYLVDPLSLNDLTYLGPIFANPNIEKIFHAAEYDVLGLQRDYEFTFANFFDTMIAARTLGYPAVGLGSLLAEKFGIDVDKHNQKADWGQRPLTAALIDYARLDTHYLIRLRNLLESELREIGRWELAREDFSRSCFVNNGNHREQRNRWERILGHQELDQRQWTILNELCISREKMAERLNRPLFKVMSDNLLLETARALPQAPEDLSAIGMTERQIQRYGRIVLEAVQRGANAALVEPKGVTRMPNAVLDRMQRLKAWRKKKAQELKVESDVILPRPFIFAIAEQNPRSPEALADVMAEIPWRLENFGPEIMKTLGIKSLIGV